MLPVVNHYAECHYADCRYAACLYTECRYTECHYAECRGALITAVKCFTVHTSYGYARKNI